MKLERYRPQETLPSHAPTAPVDLQDYSRFGRAVDKMGDTLRATGINLFNAGSAEREDARRQEWHRQKVEEDLEVQEGLTTFKTHAAEVMERRRAEYSPGASEEDASITDFAKNTITELREIQGWEAFAHMKPPARARFREAALQHIDTLIPDLNKSRTGMLQERSEARLGQSKAVYEHQANRAESPIDVMQAMDGYADDLAVAVKSGTLGVDKAVERANTFNAAVAESWFNGQIGRDPEGLFQAMRTPPPEHAYLFGLLGGKDRTGFTQEHERRVLDGIERKRKDGERNLEAKQTEIENTFWESFFNGSFEGTKRLVDQFGHELKKLKPERYKSIVKEVSDLRDAGGRGDENKTNYWKTKLSHDASALGNDEILRMSGLNWVQKQELYKAKRTQVEFERAASSDAKHFSNDSNYTFYSREMQDQLGVIKLSPFTTASSLQLLSQAEIAFRTEYERVHREKGGHVTQEDARLLMQQIVKTTRQNIGFKAKTYGEIPRFTNVADLQAAKDNGRLTNREYADEYQKLKAWRELNMDGTGDAPGEAPTRDFKKRGKD